MQKFILSIVPILLLTACGQSTQEPEIQPDAEQASSQAEMNEELPEGQFSYNEYGNFGGDFYVEGYATVVKVPEPFCEQDCAEYDYVSFMILKNGNKAFDEFLKKNQGNSFVGEEYSIGLGCPEDGIITYENDSDEYGMKQFTLNEETSTAILNSTPDQPVQLKLTKLELSGGRGAPVCYSHMTEIELYNPA